MILWQDDSLAIVQKPSGLIVHRTPISTDRVTLVGLLKEKYDFPLYPVHRLDRPTSGLILFAKNPEAARSLGLDFQERKVKKAYLAILRGWVMEAGIIDQPVKTPKDYGPVKRLEAATGYQPISRIELPLPNGRYDTTRLTLILATPQSGRRHQIRIHMDKISHPIIGDTRYGDSRYNFLFREHFDSHRLLLHSWGLQFTHPVTGKPSTFTVDPQEDMLLRLFPQVDLEELKKSLFSS